MEQDVPFERIGGYRILRRLATGGTSDVLLARAEGPHGFERTVVLKLLLQQFRRDAPMEKMFAREAAAYARLSHPAIVKLYDFFSAEGQLVMVLEFIDGLPLNRFRAMLRKGGEQLDDRASIFVASRVFAALAAAHGARDPETGEFAPVIHRDVNPSNVLIPWDGHVKLADFGIAKVAGVSSDTQAGFIKGTYGYMAPEQVRGEPVTVRTDVYAASLLLWELLARRKAIQRGALPEMEVLRAMAEPSLPSLDVLRPDLPQRLRDAVTRGLESSPDIRSITADEMLNVLRESVTSNEGRNVLSDLLVRVKQENDLLRSAPPPADMTPPASRSAPSSRAPAGPLPSPPMPSPRASEPSIPDLSRTALGIGQVAAVSPTGGMRVAAVAPSTRTMPLKGPTPALRPMAHAPALSEGAGGLRVTASGGGGVSDERVMTAMGVAPPPPHLIQEMSSTPSVLGKPVTLSSMPPVFGAAASARGSKDSVPPVFQTPPPQPMAPPSFAPLPPNPPPPVFAPLIAPGARPSPPVPPSPPSPPIPPPAASSSGQLEPTLKVPTIQPPPPPPPALWAALVQSEQSSAPIAPVMTSPIVSVGHAPTLPTPPPPPPPQVVSSSSISTAPRAFTPQPHPLFHVDRGALAEVPIGSGNRGAYTLIAGVALVASAAVVAAIFFAHRGVTSRVTADASAANVAAVETLGESATATSIATAASTANPTPAPTPTVTPASAVTPASVVTAAPVATPPASTASTDGVIVTPARAGGHRIFVDGRYTGDSPGPVKVPCGTHSVKVGSGGIARSVDVPCGGEVSVTPR